MSDLDIRQTLGLPSNATDEQVERYLVQLRAQALGNLAGPDGFTGVAQDARATVYEGFVDRPPRDFAQADFDGEVEMVTVTPSGAGSRVVVRVLKEGAEPVDPGAPGAAAREESRG